jgi:hypothetical protein
MLIDKLRNETGKKITEYIIAGLTIIAILSWNESIKSLIELIPTKKDTIIAKFSYSIMITIIIVIISIYLESKNVKYKIENKQILI